MSTSLIDRVRDDEILALDHFIDSTSPRTWKRDLGRAWETGHYPRTNDLDTPALQRLRNRLGPSVLTALKQTDVHRVAQEIARNVFALSCEPKKAPVKVDAQMQVVS